MQALEKNLIDSSWITIILVFLLALIVVLKMLDSEKLKGYFLALFNKGFVETEVEENVSFLNTFHIVLFIFSTTIISLISYTFIIESVAEFEVDFLSFLLVFTTVTSYFLLKWTIETVISRLFLIKNSVKFYLVSKFSYLYCISFLLFIVFIIIQYSSLNNNILFYTAAFLFLLRFVFHVSNNKNLIFSKLFYFILYICAFEIAPLFILFKLML
ncbi:DUF4271 domain-containing protein [Polaribacter aestuariivivens]|uniref:DUF4271 domain-containing protein n=1 Tax=Polaribacter aestuariivivens TaxID=2304626 RepID=UPI003F498D96